MHPNRPAAPPFLVLHGVSTFSVPSSEFRVQSSKFSPAQAWWPRPGSGLGVTNHARPGPGRGRTSPPPADFGVILVALHLRKNPHVRQGVPLLLPRPFPMLTRCPKCKHTFYRGMESCPHCGGKRRHSRFERRSRLAALLMGILTVAVVVHLVRKAGEVPPTSSPKAIPEKKLPESPVPAKI